MQAIWHDSQFTLQVLNTPTHRGFTTFLVFCWYFATHRMGKLNLIGMLSRNFILLTKSVNISCTQRQHSL